MNSFKIARNNGNILTVNGSALRIPAFFKREYDGLGYWLHIPENATSDTPLIVVLHSSYGKSDATDKPQDVDPEKLREVCARWRAGDITATAAMKELGLKANTFYRRVRDAGL